MELDRQTLLPWLRQLSRLGLVQLTPRTVIDVERLLRLPLARDPEALGMALASLLARSEGGWHQIEESFRRWRGVEAPVKKISVRSRPSTGEREAPPAIATPIEGPDEPPRLRRLFDRLRPRTGFDGLGWRHWVGMLAILALLLVQGALGTVVVIEETVRKPPPNEVDRTLAERSERELAVKELVAKTTRTVFEVVEAPREIHDADVLETTREPAPPPGPPWALALLIVASGLLAGLASRWWTSIAAYRSDRLLIEQTADDQRRRVLRSAKRQGAPYHVKVVPPLSPSEIEDAATLLGRLTSEHPGWELDVPPTIALTIEAGGRVQPVYRPAGHRTGLLVLIDVETGDHPDLYRVNRLLERWQRGGLELHRYDFDFRPDVLAKGKSLSSLAVRHEGAPLLILSRWAQAKDQGGELHWLDGLGAWPNRVWLDCDPRPLDDHDAEARASREVIERVLPRFPLTDAGLLAAARTLAAGGEHPAPSREEPMPSVRELEPALRKWAACAWVVPDPVWAQLDAIRRHLPELRDALPDAGYVHRLIEWLQDEAVALDLRDPRAHARPDQIGQRDRLEVCEQQQRDLAAWLREHDEQARRRGAGPGLEERARRLVLEQLRAANVEGDEFEVQKRDLKIDIHEAVLDPRKAKGLLKKWGHTALADELRTFLAQERWLQREKKLAIAGQARWGSGVWEVYEAWEGGHEGARLVDVLRWRAWSWERVKVVAGVAALVVGSYAAWWTWGGHAREVERTTIVRGEVVQLPATWEVKRVAESEASDDGAEAHNQLRCPDVVALPKLAPLHMKCIVGGKFLIGSPADESGRDADEGPQRIAQVGSFSIGETEVTQAQWKAVMKTSPFDCRYGCGDDYPAHGVSWNDAIDFTNRLTGLENELRSDGLQKTECYQSTGDSWEWVDHECTGYRLPTEAEWEYATRAGTTTMYSFEGRGRNLGDYGWYDENSGTDAYPVRTKQPNPWGLYDSHGNVWEWVWDRYGRYPSKGLLMGYSGPPKGSRRVLRGGSFGSKARSLRSAARFNNEPEHVNVSIGFRCARNEPAVAPTL